MALFITSTILFSVFAIVLQIALALWVYEDAKVKSDQAPVLWLLVAFFGNLIGFIIYLLAGRTKKDVPPPGKYKTLMVMTIIGFIASAGLFTAGTIHFVVTDGGGVASSYSGSFVSTRNRLKDDVWEYSARSANGHIRRSPNLTAAQLANFRVTSYSSDGVTLRLEQDNTVEIIDISGNFNEHINMGAFSPGRVRVRLEFNHARDVDVVISWRE